MKDVARTDSLFEGHTCKRKKKGKKENTQSQHETHSCALVSKCTYRDECVSCETSHQFSCKRPWTTLLYVLVRSLKKQWQRTHQIGDMYGVHITTHQYSVPPDHGCQCVPMAMMGSVLTTAHAMPVKGQHHIWLQVSTKLQVQPGT